MWYSVLYSLLLCAVKTFYHFCAISFNKYEYATFSNSLLKTRSIQRTEIGTKILSCCERAVYYLPFPLPWCSFLYTAYRSHWSVHALSFPHPWLWLAVQFPRDLLDFPIWINSENSSHEMAHNVAALHWVQRHRDLRNVGNYLPVDMV